MHRTRTLCLIAGSCSLLFLAGCAAGSVSEYPQPREVASAFVNKVVLPHYGQLVERSSALAQRLETLAADPNEANLTAARQAWVEARQSWETSESWAFGPAESGGFDGNLDDWPVNEKDLTSALATSRISPQQLSQLTTTAKGFHGLEAVLFGFNGQRPQAQQLTTSQLSYLEEAGADLARNAKGLLEAWQGPKGFGATLVSEDDGKTAIAEILQGMVGTLEEVADEKLGQPLTSRKTADLESFYSDTTQADVVANLKGVQDALLQSGLLKLIQQRDAQLGHSIEASIHEAVQAAAALPQQLNGALDDSEGRKQLTLVVSKSQRSAVLLQQALGQLS